MELQISNAASAWYKDIYEVESASLRFFVRYGGVGGNVPGFSLGIQLEDPDHIHASKELDGMLYFIEESDAWYFDGKDLTITYNEERDEPQFTYE